MRTPSAVFACFLVIAAVGRADADELHPDAHDRDVSPRAARPALPLLAPTHTRNPVQFASALVVAAGGTALFAGGVYVATRPTPTCSSPGASGLDGVTAGMASCVGQGLGSSRALEAFPLLGFGGAMIATGTIFGFYAGWQVPNAPTPQIAVGPRSVEVAFRF